MANDTAITTTKKAPKDDQSTTSKKGKFKFRLFGGGSNNKKSPKTITTTTTANGAKGVGGKKVATVSDFQLDAIGKENSTSLPGKVTTTTATTTTPNNLIPLVPLHDALTIDSAPIGRAAETATLLAGAGSTASRMKNTSTTTSKTATSGKNRSSVPRPRSLVSWICRTRYFSSLCDTVFDSIDSDQSKAVDRNELYQGLLLIHLKLGTYAGPAACKPLSRERCNEVFDALDDDQSGYLDKNEFREVMILLFGNVFLRVIVQWYMTIIFVPVAAKYLVEQSSVWYEHIIAFVQALDEYAFIMSVIEMIVEDERYEQTKNYIAEKIPEQVPVLLTTASERTTEIFQSIPETVWASIPLTLVSSILGLVVVPYVIFKVDDFFTWLGGLGSKKSDPAKSKK